MQPHSAHLLSAPLLVDSTPAAPRGAVVATKAALASLALSALFMLLLSSTATFWYPSSRGTRDILPVVSDRGQACKSFPELAEERVPEVLGKLGPALASVLKEDCAPDDVADVRYMTLRLRNLLDVFSPLYGNVNMSDGKSYDMWLHARKLLDTGYEEIGNFQDLAHSGVHYSAEDAIKRRRPVLKWYREWLLAERQYNLTDYLIGEPLRCGSCLYARTDDSRFFWKAMLPLPDESGVQSVRTLVSIQLKEIELAGQEVRTTKRDPWRAVAAVKRLWKSVGERGGGWS